MVDYPNLEKTIMHEIAHINRIIYSSKKFFFRTTPKKIFNEEAVEYFEDKFIEDRIC